MHRPLIIDIAGVQLGAADLRRLRHPLVGGVLLFARNWRDRQQLTALCQGIKALRADLLICVDQEGGRVQRFCGQGFTRLPAMGTLGDLWQSAGPQAASRAATDVGHVLGAQLRACGLDLSFAPVLDIDWGRSGVIGRRAFARSPAVVAQLARSLLHGMDMAGLAHCAKHFPGHGFALADSHHAPAQDGRSLEAILDADARPYAELATQLLAVMPAHVVYPEVDARPAGFSRRWLGGILRGRLGFGGAIFSDDLDMHAARWLDGHSVDHTQAALAALGAGCDMVLLCNQCLPDDGAPLDAWLDGMHEAAQKGHWQPDAASSARRLALLGRGVQTPPETLAQARENIARLAHPD